MGNVSCFDGIGGLCQFSEERSGELIKNALVLIEGTHKDNQGVIHEFPSDRILRIAQRTNAAMSQGYEIPLMSDHSKQLIGTDGELKKLGVFVSPFECRVIRQEDLPNPKMQHLIGKLGAFSKAKILNKVQEVQSKLINLLSPGVDLKLERLAEVSAVAFPAIHGPALFSASVQDLSFASVKEEQGSFKKQREALTESFEILLQTIQRIQKASPEQLVAVSPDQLVITAIDEFSSEIKNYFGLKVNPSNSDPNLESGQPYDPNPYADQLVKEQSTYSQQSSPVADFGGINLRRRRKR